MTAPNWTNTYSLGDTWNSMDAEEWLNWNDEDDAPELWAALNQFKDETQYEGWDHGIQFIHEHYFEQYAREFAEDVGVLDTSADWPMNCIDWEQAANELQMDYSVVEVDGMCYYYLEA
jgi:Antirestriction protein (ArdA)